MSWITIAAMAIPKLANYALTRRAIKNLPKVPKAKNSLYGQELERQSKQGIYSPETRQYMMSRIGQNTAQAANQGRGQYSGQLTRMGLENSIAGQRGMNEFALKRMKTMADKGQEIESQNELSKVYAREKYGQLDYQDKMAAYQDKYNRRTMLMQNTQNLINGLTSIIPDVAQKLEPTGFQGIVNEYHKSGDPAGLMYNLMQSGLSQEDALKVMEFIATNGG